VAVANPRSETEIVDLVSYAERTATPLTCRGAGSNLSGSAVGPGIILRTVALDRLLSQNEDRAIVQPGIRYERLNELLEPSGLSLRYDVSSGRFSTVGGNVATRAGGLRSIKYGNVDRCVRGVRFVSPVFGVVDTREGLPRPLDRGIASIRARLLADRQARQTLASRRGLKSSSGYNLQAILDHEDPQQLVAHLMVGSVGTLGVISEVALALEPLRAQRSLSVACFSDLSAASAAAAAIVALAPSAAEAMDGYGTALVAATAGTKLPAGTGAVVLVEFDESSETNSESLREVLAGRSLAVVSLDETQAAAAWEARWSMLTRIRREHESADRRYLSFVDDLAVPLPALPAFLEEVTAVFRDEGLRTIIYGHLGEGNLHMRPLIERDGWRERVHRVAEACFAAATSRGGTLTAEHGSGRNRAPFLQREWGDAVVDHMRAVKELFDPRDLLNPGVMFSDEDFTERMQF
jgi:FAD/FMN-containing dehydrogenase